MPGCQRDIPIPIPILEVEPAPK